MKLEDATKEDLIYWIVSNGLEPDEEDFTEAIKQYREAIYNEKMAGLKRAYAMTKDIIDQHNLTDKELLCWQNYLHLLKNRMEIAENEFKEFKEVLNRQENNFELREELKNFESDILFYKIERNLAEQEKLHKMYRETVAKYNELVKPFEGVPIGDVPQDILDKAIQLQEKMSNINKKSQKKEKEWRKYNKRQDEILQI